MTPKQIRTRVPRPGECDQRLERAREFWATAEAARELESAPNAVATLYVAAGIAATDAICCKKLGEYSRSENHSDAIELVSRVDAGLAAPLRRLLSDKSADTYGAAAVSAKRVDTTRSAALKPLDAARAI